MHVYLKKLIYPAIALLLFAAAPLATPAIAQSPGESGEKILESLGGPDASFEEILLGVAALSDAEIHQILLTVLRERLAANASPAATLETAAPTTVGARIDVVQQRLKRVVRGIPDILTIPGQVRA